MAADHWQSLNERYQG